MKSTKWFGLNEGDVIISLHDRNPYRDVGDIIKIINFDGNAMYYRKNTNSTNPLEWRKPTPQEIEAYNQGITNIKDIKQNLQPSYDIY